MTPLLAAGLLGLALVDSTSLGTLFIPVWLLLAPGRIRAGRFAVYLLTIAGFYLVAGVLIALGADAIVERIGPALSEDNDEPLLRGTQLVVGLALAAWGWWLGSPRRRGRRESSGRLLRWRERAMSDRGSVGGLMALAILAAGIELASMLPYLGAIGLITASDIGWLGVGATLVAYCLVMILPAALLAAARIGAHDRVQPLLQRINDWITKHSDTLVSTTVCGIGVYLALNALIILFVA